MTTQTTFEDRLLDRLRLVVVANASPPKLRAPEPRGRRWPLAAAGLTAAGAAAAFAVAIPGGTQAAYAIDSQANGTVTVHLASLSDAAGLQAALRARGIPAIVDYSATCMTIAAPSPGSGPRPGTGDLSLSQVEQTRASSRGKRATHVGVRVQVSEAHGSGGVTFTIDPTNIPAGQNLYITTYSREMNALSIGVGSRAPTPLCPPTGR